MDKLVENQPRVDTAKLTHGGYSDDRTLSKDMLLAAHMNPDVSYKAVSDGEHNLYEGAKKMKANTTREQLETESPTNDHGSRPQGLNERGEKIELQTNSRPDQKLSNTEQSQILSP